MIRLMMHHFFQKMTWNHPDYGFKSLETALLKMPFLPVCSPIPLVPSEKVKHKNYIVSSKINPYQLEKYTILAELADRNS